MHLVEFSVGQGTGGTGLTIRCNDDPIDVASPADQRRCRARQSTDHAQTLLEVCLRPMDQALRFVIILEFLREQNTVMEVVTKNTGKPATLTALLRHVAKARPKVRCIDPCPCGSGKKFKKSRLT